MLWISYDEFISQPCATMLRILQHSDLNISDESLYDAVNSVILDSLRFNLGISGRVMMELSTYQINVIRNISSFMLTSMTCH